MEIQAVSKNMKLSVILDINDVKLEVSLDLMGAYYDEAFMLMNPIKIEYQRIESLIDDESIKKEKLYILGLIYEDIYVRSSNYRKLLYKLYKI